MDENEEDALVSFVLNAISEFSRRIRAIELYLEDPSLNMAAPEVRTEIRRSAALAMQHRSQLLAARPQFRGSQVLAMVDAFFQLEAKPPASDAPSDPNAPPLAHVVELFPKPDGEP